MVMLCHMVRIVGERILVDVYFLPRGLVCMCVILNITAVYVKLSRSCHFSLVFSFWLQEAARGKARHILTN